MAPCCLILSLIYSLGVVIGEKVSGTVHVADSDGFAFLGKFCFQDLPSLNFSVNGAAAGTVDVELTNKGGTSSDSYVLVMYDDQENSWPLIYDSDLSCFEKLDGGYKRLDRRVELSPYETYERTLSIHQHIRPRWWWLYLANCEAMETENGTNSLSEVDFELHFKQNTTKWLKVEVGSNNDGLNVMYSVYLAFYVVLFGLQLYAYYVYTIQQYIHQVIKLLTATIALQLFAVLFHFADWIVFTETGEHEIFFPIIASLCEIMASTVFLLLLMVLAQGWTVSRFEVVYPKLLLSSVVTIAVVQCVLYIWILIGLDEQSTTYAYNTVPQYIYGSVFIIIGIVFVAQCVFSYKNEPLDSKKNLYILLAAFFSIWFLWPLLRILIGDGFKPWNRDVFVQTISMTLTTLTYFAMMMLMWPTWAHQYFNLSMVDTQERILDAGQSDMMAQSVNNNKTNYKVLEQDRL